jgi:hypothetical protein
MKICRTCGKRTNVDTDFICAYCGGPLKSVVSSPLSKNQIGTFQIQLEVLEVFYKEILKLLEKCFVVRCEYLYEIKSFMYTVACEDFKPVKEGMAPVILDILMDKDTHECYFRDSKEREIDA